MKISTILPIANFVFGALSYGAGYATHDGTATSSGVDDWTYINTSIFAVVKYSGGIASELSVTNGDLKHAIYISGLATGTDQYNASTGRTGEEVPAGKTMGFPLGYQTKAKPIQQVEFTYQYWEDGTRKKRELLKDRKPAVASESSPPTENRTSAATKSSDKANAQQVSGWLMKAAKDEFPDEFWQLKSDGTVSVFRKNGSKWTRQEHLEGTKWTKKGSSFEVNWSSNDSTEEGYFSGDTLKIRSDVPSIIRWVGTHGNITP